MSLHPFILSFLFLLLPLFVQAQQQQEVVLTGVYNGKNLYVQNPLSSNLKDYCTREVWVNGEQVFVNPRSSAFTVNLSHLKEQQPVAVRILYSSGCAPKVINPQVIKTRNNFQYLSIQVDKQKLEWLTSGEKGSGKFFVEKLVEQRWQPVVSVEGYGEESSRYQAEVEHHSGANQYRIKYLQQDGETFYSRVHTYQSPVEPVTFAPTRVSDKIYLSRETEYIVSDPKGNQLLKGFGKEIKLGHLNSGLYYLNIDNRLEKFYKK
ncbi:hypothetical protein [Nafulsella turpanensis]|uniref:hypothetical protein n=1 Tax=Nafulsella turpanensis TaxID=1265690 RepID=UPI00034560F5|nr:hypothetical protein [Nafulsella turpanensis]